MDAMQRALRTCLALLMLVGVVLAGGASPASADPDRHAGMADCPHAALADHGKAPTPGHPATAMPMMPCCTSLPPASSAETAMLRVPVRQASPALRPVSDRLPAGDAPGPELPPPRA